MSEDALELVVARHAKSSWRFGDLDDFHRPLNKRGLRDLVRMPRLVAERVPAPERALSSDAVRAVQTCQALADGFDLAADAVHLHHALYLASDADILAVLARAAGEARRVLLVGHNPGLTNLYNRLVGNPVENLPTLAVAHLRLHAPQWDALTPGCAEPRALLLPKELLRDGS